MFALAFALASAPGTARAQVAAAAPQTVSVGDWQLAPMFEVRALGEYRRDAPDLAGVDVLGNATTRARNAYGVLERTRLGLGAEYAASRGDAPVLRMQLTLQDARAWGTPTPNAILGAEGSSPSSTGLYEGWVEARTSSARPAFVRLGRQAVTWGDGRLLSNADASPVARTLDALRLHASPGIADVELLAAILDTPTPIGPAFGSGPGAPPSSGSQLYGAQLALAFAPLFRAELSLLARVSRGTPVSASRFDAARANGELYVGSLRVFGEARGWRYAAEGAYELGRAELLGDADIGAWAAAGYVEKAFDDVVLFPTLRLEGDYASGDDGGSTYRQFDPLLPDVRTLHGAMDLFAWSNTTQGSARVTVVPWTEGKIAVEYRYAHLAQSSGEWIHGYLGEVGRGRAGTELGHEIDAWASWRPWAPLELVANYSVFVMGDGAKAILNAVENEAVRSRGSLTAGNVAHQALLQVTVRGP